MARPGALDVLSVVPIAIVVHGVVRSVTSDALTGPAIAVALAAGTALLLGAPFVHWALDHEHKRLRVFVILGGIAGALPCFLLFAAAAVGVAARYGGTYVRWLLERRAILPIYGSISWGHFLSIEIVSIAIGIASGAIYWLLRFERQRSAARAWGGTILTLSVAIAVAALLGR